MLTNGLCGCSKDPQLEQSSHKQTWSRNVNAWEHLPSRHAPDVLRDFIKKFRNLEWLPAEYSPYSTPSVGSPNHSDAIACEKALVYVSCCCIDIL